MNKSNPKEQAVRHFFEQTDVYLTYDYNLRIRLETIATFLNGKRYPKVLDMPCGTGDLTIPLLDQFDDLTLMDFSKGMIEKAKENLPPEKKDKVRFVHTNFYHHDFGDQQFDLVVAVGILAHIESPMEFVRRIAHLVKPNGHLIIQNTNASASFTRLIRAHQWLKRTVGKSKYTLNWVAEDQLLSTSKECGLHLQQSFRYHQSWLGFSHLFSNEAKYTKTTNHFGSAATPKKQKSGSDVMYFFQKQKPLDHG